MPDTQPDTHRIIVIGASAGGVEALLYLARRLPPDLPAAVLIVLHIGSHRSHLPDLLNASRPHQALFAQTGQTPQAGRVYVCPPDRHLLIEQGVLRLYNGPKEHHARPAINPLFRSAALDLGRRAVGVILTGLLDDGSAGLQAIKACGGTCVVQDPAEAVEPSMPVAALAATRVDHVVTLAAMVSLLPTLAVPLDEPVPVIAPAWLRREHAISLGRHSMEEMDSLGQACGYTCPDCGGALFELSQGQPLRFLCHTGHAFSLRSLAWAQAQVTDEALWAGVRALQEKESLLRRIAKSQSPPSAADSLAQADTLAELIAAMRRLVSAEALAPSEVPPG